MLATASNHAEGKQDCCFVFPREFIHPCYKPMSTFQARWTVPYFSPRNASCRVFPLPTPRRICHPSSDQHRLRRRHRFVTRRQQGVRTGRSIASRGTTRPWRAAAFATSREWSQSFRRCGWLTGSSLGKSAVHVGCTYGKSHGGLFSSTQMGRGGRGGRGVMGSIRRIRHRGDERAQAFFCL